MKEPTPVPRLWIKLKSGVGARRECQKARSAVSLWGSSALSQPTGLSQVRAAARVLSERGGASWVSRSGIQRSNRSTTTAEILQLNDQLEGA